MKHIFGTLDEDDGLAFNNAIESVIKNEEKMSSLIKENVLVTNSIITRFNETILKVQLNEYHLNEAINKFSSVVENISIATDKVQLQLSINELFSNLEMSLLTLSFQLEDIINAIMFSSLNKLHPAIMTPTQLHKELVDSFRYLPQGLELPVPLEINMMHIIMNISKVSSYFMKPRLVFVLQIPLVSNKLYKLYHNIPLPTPHNVKNPETFSLIIPSTKYIAITIDKNHYFDLDSLNNCLIISHEHFICDVPNVYATDSKITCESELLSKVINKLPDQCETKFIYGKVDIWKNLNNNKWIFIQSESSKIVIECQKWKIHRENILLGTGILSLPQSCIGYNKNTVLIGKINKNIHPEIITFDYNIINDTCCNKFKLDKVKDNVSPINLEKIDLDNLTIQKESLKRKLLETEIDTDMPHIIKYGTHYSTLNIIILVIIILVLAYFISIKIIYCYKKCNKSLGLNIELKDENNPDNTNLEMEEQPSYPSIRCNV